MADTGEKEARKVWFLGVRSRYSVAEGAITTLEEVPK